MTAAEQHALLARGMGITAEIPKALFPELFQAQAAATPDELAVVSGATELTYAQLNARSSQLARYLIAQGLGPEDVVGLALPRGRLMVEALLAVLKTGAAYLPIDLDYNPQERISFILADARPACLIAVTADIPRLADAGMQLLLLDDPGTARAIARQPAGNVADSERKHSLRPFHPAYVIYTSGSSGLPKGVIIPHAGVANLAPQYSRRSDIFAAGIRMAGKERLRIAHISSWSWDASVAAILWLHDGHELHLINDDVRYDAERFVAYIRRAGIDCTDTSSSFVQELIHHGLLKDGEHVPHLMIVGGEAMPPSVWHDLHLARHTVAYNSYGPTECTIDVTDAEIIDRAAPVIGKPVWNMSVFVLDERLRPAPPGVTGELYISGAGLARGYLGRPGLTGERFVACPFGRPGERMYRTGDLARWSHDGELEFAGRADEQVNVRGFRVELGEMEARLAEHPLVRQAVVVAREDRPGDWRLVGYATLAGDAVIDGPALRAHLAGLLPEFMVPAVVVVVDALPVTPSGKVDRRALPAPDYGALVSGRGPRSASEEILCGLFAEALGVEAVGVDDSFFDLGGHSLLMMRLVSRMRSVLGVEVGVRALFETPTVAGLARLLGDAGVARRGVVAGLRPEVLPLSFAQQRLWFLDRLEGSSAVYNVSFAFRLSGVVDEGALAKALSDVAERHESLRTVFGEADGVPFQRVLDGAPGVPGLEMVKAAAGEVTGVLAKVAARPFDLAEEVPWRAVLVRSGPGESVLLLVVHHVAVDGWSEGPLLRDLSVAYQARRRGEAPGWERLAVQYADYALWQREMLGGAGDRSGELGRQVQFWQEALADLPQEVTFPWNQSRPAVASYRGATVEFEVPAGLHAALVQVGRRHGATLFMVVQSAVAGLLGRLGAETDIPLGFPVAGRTDDSLDELVGFFVNTLVLRADVSGDPTFGELLGRVREADLAATRIRTCRSSGLSKSWTRCGRGPATRCSR